MSQTGHQQTAVQDGRGWKIYCECGAVTDNRPTNFDAWKAPLNHQMQSTREAT